MGTTTPVYRFTIRELRSGGPRSAVPAADMRVPGLGKVRSAQIAELYFVRGMIAPEELKLLGRVLFCDPVSQSWECRLCGTDPGSGRDKDPGSGDSATEIRILETAFRPGVTDPVAVEIVRAARELGVTGMEAAATGTRYEFLCDAAGGQRLSDAELEQMASKLYANPVIQRHAIGEIEPVFPEDAAPSGMVETIRIRGMGDAELLQLSTGRRAALDLSEMRALKAYFVSENRDCTDVEFEAVAQTWSEHCVHKTFKALIEIEGGAAAGLPDKVDNILKTYIKSVTDELDAPWVISAFTDNAGILEFDDEYEISFKVETHNHPSAIEPFGGANTGVGGVIRDILGVSARPVAVTDILCFGPADAAPGSIPEGVAHPARIRNGVVSGVQDYGNKMGIPTVNGGIHYHEGYSANPLVYCGCAGIAPRGKHRNKPEAGDRVVAIGGRTGRDGIRGATFSSMPMDHMTQELSGSSVQIGAPITEKKVAEIIVSARDAGLYTAITDCGAGGLSSAVGEMASEIGADIELDAVALKYSGLAPWEIWLSEAQERMVLAVSPSNMEALRELCRRDDVELFDLGHFTGAGRLVVRKTGVPVLDLSCFFLHHGIPQRRLKAAAPGSSSPLSASLPAPASAPVPGPAIREALAAVLSHHSVASKEWAIRRYDHEVRGATRIGPFCGSLQTGPSDAAVLKPLETSGERAFSISNGFNCRYGEADAYRAAVSALDEAVRNSVASGADPDRIAVLDNFCWGDPAKPETMWTLLLAAKGCRDAALAHRTPFVSGKDSFNNEYTASDGVRVSVPPSLLISAIGIVPTMACATTVDLKTPGDILYLVGSFDPTLGASVYADIFGPTSLSYRTSAALSANVARKAPGISPAAPAAYRALHKAMATGLVAACHDLSDGGVAAAAAEMCLGGGLGLEIDIASLAESAAAGAGVSAEAYVEAGMADAASAALLLFGETNGCLLVEVSDSKGPAFEAVMSGSPSRRVGVVNGSGRMSVSDASGPFLNAEIEEMAAAFGAGKEYA